MSTEIIHFAAQYAVYSGWIIFGAGVIGNLLNLLVLTQLKLFRDNRCAFYLTVESITSFLYQLFSISLIILTSIYGDDGTARSLVWCRFRYIFAQTIGLSVSYTICVAAIDQYFSTNYWFNQIREMCTLKLARCIIFAVFCIWFVHSIAFAMFSDVLPSVGCTISNPIWLHYSSYIFYPLWAGFLPLVISAFFSILAFRNVRRIVRRQLPIVRRRLDRQMTAMVLTRVAMFVCFVFPYTLYRSYTVNFPIPRTKPMEFAIGRLMQAIFLSFTNLNYTVKFFVDI